MKNLIVALVAIVTLTSAAYADGFRCESDDLVVKVFNNTDPSAGTRNAAAMIVSDPSVSAGNKTIARFTDVNSTLGNSGAEYTALVDLRFNDSNKAGRLLSETKLGQVKYLILDIAFNYAEPLNNGDHTDGQLTIVKRNGQEIKEAMDCARYLKINE